jgi:Rrf2 family protein
MQLRNQVEWALHCCSLLAGVAPGHTLAAKDLAAFHGVPKEYLSKALQALSQAGLVEGTLGPSGGYRLSRDPSQITFLDIVEAVEGKGPTFVCENIRFNNPCLPHDYCSKKPCGIARVMWAADKAWRDSLNGVSLADFLVTLQKDVPAAILKKSAAWVEERS